MLISLLLTAIPVDRRSEENNPEQKIYLNSNGVHLDIIIPISQADSSLLSGLKYLPDDNFLAFGWGDKNFYLNTPTWGDLTLKNAFIAMCMNKPTLVHVTRYESIQANWIEIPVTREEFMKMNSYLFKSFHQENGTKIRLKGKGYSTKDDFYKAEGNYTIFKTCNSWVNTGFKNSGLKSCLWTPFDFGLMWKYE